MSERNYWTRRRRMTRRTLLSASARAGVGAAGLALVGCGDDDDDDDAGAALPVDQQAQQQADQAAQQAADQTEAQEAPAEEPAEEEQTVLAEGGDITAGGVWNGATTIATHDYFDPHRGVFGPTQYFHSQMYNYFIRWQNKEQGIMEGDIASLPEIPDDTTYVFSIDNGARFWDRFPTEGGRLFTAEDARFNFERQINAVDATGAEDGTFLQSSAYQRTDSIEVVDEFTIRLTTPDVDATYLGVHLGPFSWMTSPEGAQEFGDRWRDDPTNIDLNSGTGPFIGVKYEPDVVIEFERNPNYWKDGPGGQLPYLDGIHTFNIFDQAALEAAYRNKQLYSVTVNKEAIEGIQADFPDHDLYQQAGGFTIEIRTNFNPDWPGEDGLGNPWVDRRFWFAYHLATDRFLHIDTVYLGDARVTSTRWTPWFSEFWAPNQEELLTWPGYRPNHDDDIAEARQLLDASGYDTSRTLRVLIPDVWETAYPGMSELNVSMYEAALGIPIELDVQPYTVWLQRLEERTFPGSVAAWTNPPVDLDPTTEFGQFFIPGSSRNSWAGYDYPPVADILREMQVTLDLDKRGELNAQVLRILMGVDPAHGLDGITPEFGVMNPISKSLFWPFMRPDPNIFQFAHSTHHYATVWMDAAHPGAPA